MSGGSRSLPVRPSLRFLKLEAKRRLAAGEFTTLHDAQAAVAREHGLPSWAGLKQACTLRPEPESHALDQLHWVISRFSAADAPGWTAPDEDELRQHFDDRFLAVLPPGGLVEQASKMAADLRAELVILSAAPLEAVVQLVGLRYYAVADATPPHRLTGLRGFPLGDRITDPRVKAPPPPRTLGELPGGMAGGMSGEMAGGMSGEMVGGVAALAEEACAELGLPALLLAGGEPGRAPWVVAIGHADLVQPSNGGYAVLGQLIADVTGQPYARAAARLVLDPLGMRDSRFPDSPADIGPGAVTGYTVTADGALEPFLPQVSTVPAIAGLWSTGADLVRLGTGWSLLLPAALAREALTVQAGPGQGGLRTGLGWLLTPSDQTAVHGGAGPDAVALLRSRIRDGRTHVVLTSRMITVESIDNRLLRSWTSPTDTSMRG